MSRGDVVLGLARRLAVLGLFIAWAVTGRALLLGGAAYCAFAELLAALENLAEDVRDMPGRSVEEDV